MLAGFFVVLGRFELLCGYLIGIVAHEIAHNRMAKLRGYGMGTITIMPYGGVVDCGEEYNDSDNILIALAAPFFNLAFSTFIVAAWWVVPEVYNYTQDICVASLALGIVNLLPFYPLDGSRVVISLAKNKLRAIKIVRIITVIAGIIMFVGGIALAVVTLNVTLPIFGLFLVFGGIFASKGQTYFHITGSLPFLKNYKNGLTEKTVYISESCPLFKLLGHIDKDSKCFFVLVDDRGEETDCIGEERLGELCVENELSTPVAQALKNSKNKS